MNQSPKDARRLAARYVELTCAAKLEHRATSTAENLELRTIEQTLSLSAEKIYALFYNSYEQSFAGPDNNL